MYRKAILIIALLCAAIPTTWAQTAYDPELEYVYDEEEYHEENPWGYTDYFYCNFTYFYFNIEQDKPITFTKRVWNEETKELTEEEATISTYYLLDDDLPDEIYLCRQGYYVVRGESKKFRYIHIAATDVRIILADGCELKSSRIVFDNWGGYRLSIFSQSSGDNQGKITSPILGKNVFDLIIHGGKIVAEAPDDYYPGIGQIGNGCGGSIRIYGGDITAKGGDSATGIGGDSTYDGNYGYSRGEIAEFKMYGGKVKCYGGDYAAGLGGGGGYGFIDRNNLGGPGCSNVQIYGGVLYAYGGYCGAGIGSGHTPTGFVSQKNSISGGNLYVYGGQVAAYGGKYGAGIGGGHQSSGARVEVYGGEVYAYGGTDAAGIGSGEISATEFFTTDKKDVAWAGPDGNTLIVHGGYVRAEGKSNGAGIGGGETGRGPLDVIINGGTVVAIAGEDCDATEDGGGCAIGCGAGLAKATNIGGLTLGDDIKVLGANSEEDAGQVFTASERNNGCWLRNYVMVQPCNHQEIYYTFDDAHHTKHCRFCNVAPTSVHEYTDNACICGRKYNDQTSVATIKVYTSTDGMAYADTPQTDQLLKGYEYVFPQPTQIEGLTFMGYLKAETKPTGIEMLDDEFLGLNNTKDVIRPEEDATYYARYRYDYNQQWTWGANHSSATVTVTGAIDGLNLENKTAELYPASQNPTQDAAGYNRFTANYTYKKADDLTYNFSDNVNIPYLFSLELKNASDNEEVITENLGSKVKTLTLSDRTFYKDGSWNTLCLPFSLTATQVKNFLQSPAKLMTLSSSSYDDEVLTLNFAEATTIEAGKPYLIKWASSSENLVNPSFTDVYIENAISDAVTEYIDFSGTYSPVVLKADDKSVLYLGDGNTLYYPTADVTLNACRGGFALRDITAGDLPASTRSIVLNFGDDDATAIKTVSTPASPAADAWYALDGRRLSGKPAQKGIYITNGQKVVFK